MFSSTLSFIVGEWDACNCEGYQRRSVECKILMEFSQTVLTLPDTQCTSGTASSKPANEQKCSPPVHCLDSSSSSSPAWSKIRKNTLIDSTNEVKANKNYNTLWSKKKYKPARTNNNNSFNHFSLSSNRTYVSPTSPPPSTAVVSSPKVHLRSNKNVPPKTAASSSSSSMTAMATTDELLKMRKYVNKIEKSTKLIQTLLTNIIGVDQKTMVGDENKYLVSP